MLTISSADAFAFAALIISIFSYLISRRAYLAATLPPVTSKLIFENAGHGWYKINNEHVTVVTRMGAVITNHSADISLIDLTQTVEVSVRKGVFGRVSEQLSYAEREVLDEKKTWQHLLDYKHPNKPEPQKDEVLEILLSQPQFRFLKPNGNERTVDWYDVIRNEPVYLLYRATYTPGVYDGKPRSIHKRFKLTPVRNEYEPGKYVLVDWDDKPFKPSLIQRIIWFR